MKELNASNKYYINDYKKYILDVFAKEKIKKKKERKTNFVKSLLYDLRITNNFAPRQDASHVFLRIQLYYTRKH